MNFGQPPMDFGPSPIDFGQPYDGQPPIDYGRNKTEFKDGKLNKVTEDGIRSVLYDNGGVLFQPPGLGHSGYKGKTGDINKIDPVNNNLLDYFNK